MRVYLPATMSMLADLAASGATAEPLPGYAVTAAVRASMPTADQEELEYAVLMAAAGDSLDRLAADPGEPARRVVVVAEVPEGDVVDASVGGAGAVHITSPVPLTRVTAVHVDEPAAEPAVRRAAGKVDGALAEQELLWYATQEIPDLLTVR